MVDSILLANYIDFITANTKVLHMAGFVLVLATPQGLNLRPFQVGSGVETKWPSAHDKYLYGVLASAY